MQWNELYDRDHEPLEAQMTEYVGTPLWEDLACHLRQAYGVQPKLFYSDCSMQAGYWKGWNVKYKKGGRALCSLYPKQGYFVALIAIGAKEAAEADLLIPLCDAYTQALYRQTESGKMGRSLAMEVTDENILRDVKNLVALRAPARKAR